LKEISNTTFRTVTNEEAENAIEKMAEVIIDYPWPASVSQRVPALNYPNAQKKLLVLLIGRNT
jgi:hypothetical protein